MTDGEEKPFADKVTATPRFVFSHTLDRAPWDTWDEARTLKLAKTQTLSSGVVVLCYEPAR